MPWTGAGVFNRTFSWVADKAAGLNISSSRMDTDTDDIASSGFGNCLTRDGQGQPTANLPMGNFRHTGVANAQNRTDYASLAQVQDGVSFGWTTAGGTSDAITATYTPAITALVDGQVCWVRATAANATTTPTFSPNGLTPRTITKAGGAALVANDIPGNLAEVGFRYNLANTRWELINPEAPTSGVGRLMPAGIVLPYAGSAAPAGFLLCGGQAVSRSTFAALFAVIGTTYGAGDGSTTFNLPDLRGRAVFGKDNMNGTAANRITVAGGNFDGTVLGNNGGTQNHSLGTADLPNITLTWSNSNTYSPGTQSVTNSNSASFLTKGGGAGDFSLASGTYAFSESTASVTVPGYTPTGAITTNAGAGNTNSINGSQVQTAFSLLDPGLILNFIIST